MPRASLGLTVEEKVARHRVAALKHYHKKAAKASSNVTEARIGRGVSQPVLIPLTNGPQAGFSRTQLPLQPHEAIVNFNTAPASPADELARILPRSRSPSPTLPPPPRSAVNTIPPPLPVRGDRSPTYNSTVAPTFRPPTRIRLSSNVPPDFRPVHAPALRSVPSRSPSAWADLNNPHYTHTDVHTDVHNEPSHDDARHHAHDDIFNDTPPALHNNVLDLPPEGRRNNNSDNDDDDHVLDIDDLTPNGVLYDDERVQTPVSVIDGKLWPDVSSVDHSLQTQVCEGPHVRSDESRRREDPLTSSDGSGPARPFSPSARRASLDLAGSPTFGRPASPSASSSSAVPEERIRFEELCDLIADHIYKPQSRIQRGPPRGEPLHPHAPAPISMEEFLSNPRLKVPDLVGDFRLRRGDPIPEEMYGWEHRHRLFSGFLPDQSIHARIGLEALSAPTPRTSRRATFDIDSVIGRLRGLGSLRSGLKLLTVQTPLPHITSPLHLGTFPTFLSDRLNADGTGRVRSVGLHEIPQVVLGRLAECDDFEVIVMFPSAARSNQQISRLPDRFFDIWYDQILFPALCDVMAADCTAIIPATAEEARLKSTLKFTQTRTAGVTNQPRLQLLSYFINPAFLADIWVRVREIIEDGRHRLFEEPWLLINAKGVKARYRDAEWAVMMQNYRRHMDGLFYPDAFVWRWNDLGWQWSPTLSGNTFSDRPGDSEILLWVTSYIEEIYDSLRELDARFTHTTKIYPQYFLPRVGSGSFEPSLTGTLRECGLAYVQHYNPVQDFWAAGDHYIVRARSHVTDLAQDPRIVQAFRHIAHAVEVDFESLIAAYRHMKQVVHHVTDSCGFKSAGLRFESRLSDAVLDGVDVRMQDWVRLEGRTPAFPGPCTGAYVTMPTSTFLRWIRWNVNRLCYGFEFIYRGVPDPQVVSYEQTRAMTMFLRSLPCFFGSGPAGVHARFWRNRLGRRAHSRHAERGFAMQRAMDHTNFPWLAPRFNFHSMTFETSVAHYLGFHHTDITRRLRHSFRAIRPVQNLQQRADEAHQWLVRLGGRGDALHLIFDFLHQLCATAFRQDVFRYIHGRKGNKFRGQVLDERYRDDALEGRLALCERNLSRAIQLPNRRRGWRIKCDSRDKIRSYHTLFNKLFSVHADRAVRNEPYFVLVERVARMITGAVGPQTSRRWYEEFREYLRVTCWLLPYPGNNRFILTTAAGNEWCFFAQTHARVQDDAQRQGAGTFVRHPEWRDRYDVELWREHCKHGMRGTPEADRDLLDMPAADFLGELERGTGEEITDLNGPADLPYDPQHHYSSSSDSSASSSPDRELQSPAIRDREPSPSHDDDGAFWNDGDLASDGAETRSESSDLPSVDELLRLR